MNTHNTNFQDIPTGNAIAIHDLVGDVTKARSAALAALEESLAHLEAAHEAGDRALEAARRANFGRSARNRLGGESAERFFRSGFNAEAALASAKEDLDRSIWNNLLDQSGMRDLMDAQAKKEFSENLAKEVPEATEDNIHATFETLMLQAGDIFLRGLANAFTKLDKRFRSHDAFKVGKVVILERVFSTISGQFEHGVMRDTIVDIERIFAKLEGKQPDPSGLMGAISDSRDQGYEPQQSVTESRYFKIRGWKNGNAHLWFTRPDLVKKVNQLLGIYYGEVLPDAAEPSDEPEDYKVRSTEVSKDLQFYATPTAVCDRILENLFIRPGARVLEPSAGEGALARAILRDTPEAELDVVEIHPGRAQSLKQIRGIKSVQQSNFLKMEPRAIYDVVVMNPPFYRTHWMDHVRHAFEFLAPGGKLLAILPASAEFKEDKMHQSFHKWVKSLTGPYDRPWWSLPAGSFASSGTNINTVVLRLERDRR